MCDFSKQNDYNLFSVFNQDDLTITVGALNFNMINTIYIVYAKNDVLDIEMR